MTSTIQMDQTLRRFGLIALFTLGMSLLCFGQDISVPKEVDAYEPIIASLPSVPTPEGVQVESKISWRTSSDKVKIEPFAVILQKGAGGEETRIPDNNTIHIWGPPGDHWIEAAVVTIRYRLQKVLVPDPEHPEDVSKAKTETVKLLVDFSQDRHTANFKIRGLVPTPKPLPDPDPEPHPPDAPSAELQALLQPVKVIMAKADPAKTDLFAEAWADFFVALSSGTVPKTVGDFRSSITAFLNAAAVKANLQGAFPGFSIALNQAFVTQFGTNDVPIDPVKAKEFTAAVVWACTR